MQNAIMDLPLSCMCKVEYLKANDVKETVEELYDN